MSSHPVACKCFEHATAPSVHQTLDELDFSRGIWSQAVDGDLKAVQRHLDKNMNVDEVDASGFTALHYACRNGHLDVCKLLLDRKASPNVQTRSGGATPLHRAAYCGFEDIVVLLLENKADPMIPDNDGKLPLHKAAEKCHTNIVNLLVASNPAAKTHRDNKGQVPADCVPDSEPELKTLLKKDEKG